MDISVVIPSYNSIATIDRCLAALHRQVFSGSYEVILVDSSIDGTAEQVEKHFPWVRLIHLKERALPGKARNIGIAKARGSIVAFTDADCLPAPDWLWRHYQAQQNHDVVGGALGNANPASLVGWASYLLEFSGYTPCRRHGYVDCLVSANLSCRRILLQKHPFPEDLWPGEDRILAWQLAEISNLFYDGGAIVEHVNRSGLENLFRHQARSGRAAAVAWPRIGLHGKLCRYSWLVWLTPPWRSLLTITRVLRDTPRFLLPAMLTMPLILSGAMVWAHGFYKASGRKQ